MGKQRKYGHWGRIVLSSAVHMVQAPAGKKQHTKKTPEISTENRKTDGTRIRARTNVTTSTYETEEEVTKTAIRGWYRLPTES